MFQFTKLKQIPASAHQTGTYFILINIAILVHSNSKFIQAKQSIYLLSHVIIYVICNKIIQPLVIVPNLIT